MKTRAANKVQTNLVTLLFGSTFTGKTTLGLQLAYFKRVDGKPFRLAVIDAEGGGVDNAINKIEDDGLDMRNIQIFYTQSLQELNTILDKIKNHDTFYEYDDDGNETDIPMVDADGEPFFPDAVFIDGTTIFRLTSEQGLLELSKKRNTIKADQAGLVGAERFVKIQGADLEFKDYKKLNYSGQNLVLNLMALGVNVVMTAREKDEVEYVMGSDGKQVSVNTGKKTYDSFKGIDFNANMVIHMFRDSDTNTICAEIIKDRTEVHKPGEIIEDPTLLDWQVVIDRNKGKKEFVLKNDLDKAVETDQEMYEKETTELINSVKSSSTPITESNPAEELNNLKAEIKNKISKLSPTDKVAMKDKLTEAGLPTAFKNETDVEVLKKVLATIG